MTEAKICEKQYQDNLCDVVNVPAIRKYCAEWLSCMMRDSNDISRSKITAEVIAVALDEFIQKLSHKTLVFILKTELRFMLV